MRIAYFVHLNDGPRTGIYTKILMQVKSWTELGHEAKLFILTEKKEIEESLKADLPEERVTVIRCPTSFPNRLIGLLRKMSLMDLLFNNIEQWEPDLIYTREHWGCPPLVQIARRYPLFMEINGNALVEIWDNSKTGWLLWVITRGALLSSVTGLCFVSNELAEMRAFRKYGKPFLVLGNGVDFSTASSRYPWEGKKVNNEIIRLVFLGTPGLSWHGVDKILTLAKLNPDWIFDIIGYNPDDVKGEIPGNVLFHGMLRKEEYDDILDEADCAIDCLALHRKGMNETSSLKAREYLVHGLPVIMCYKDTDFPEGTDFILQIPNTEDNVLISNQRIREFVLSWKGRRVPLEKISHLDVKVKEAQRIRFFQSLITKRDFDNRSK